MTTFFTQHRFIISLVLAIALAGLLQGVSERLQSVLEVVVPLGIVTIFVLQGLTLPTDKLVAGAAHWRHHAFVLGWNFVGFPLLIALLWVPLMALLGRDLAVGFWFLALVPTTISSAVALTSTAGGNPATAVFSTVSSNLVGVFLAPLVAFLVLSIGMGAGVDPLPMLQKISVLILVPLALGQVLQRIGAVKHYAQKRKAWARELSNNIIVLIVFSAFLKSFGNPLWREISTVDLLALFLVVAGMLLAVTALVWFSAGLGRLAPDIRVSALFCASQKTLAVGVPLASSLEAAAGDALPPLALLVLPLMIYHPMQLLLGSLMLPRLQGFLEGSPSATSAAPVKVS